MWKETIISRRRGCINEWHSRNEKSQTPLKLPEDWEVTHCCSGERARFEV